MEQREQHSFSGIAELPTFAGEQVGLIENRDMRTVDEVDRDFYPPEPLPVPRIVRETEKLCEWLWLRGDHITLDATGYAAVKDELGIMPHRLDAVIDHLERSGRARSQDCGGGVSVRILRTRQSRIKSEVVRRRVSA